MSTDIIYRNRFIKSYKFELKRIGKQYFISKIHDGCNIKITYPSFFDITENQYYESYFNNVSHNINNRVIQVDDVILGYSITTNRKITNVKFNCNDTSIDDIYSDLTSSNLPPQCIVIIPKELRCKPKDPIIVKRKNKFKSLRQYWDYESPCEFCGYIYLKSNDKNFRIKCCRYGGFMKRNELPPTLMSYCTLINNDHFLKYSYVYNNILALGQLGPDKKYNSQYLQTFGGSVTLRGRTYLTYERPNKQLNLLYFLAGDVLEAKLMDEITSLGQYLNVPNNNISPITFKHVEILTELLFEQKQFNSTASQYCNIMDILNEHRDTAAVNRFDYSQLQLSFKEKISIYDISCFRLNDRYPPGIHVKLNNNYNQRDVVSYTHPKYEALCYPLLMPYGEDGFSPHTLIDTNMNKTMEFYDYICCQILQPEPSLYYINPDTGLQIACNRFNIFSKLAQYYLVDQYSRIVDGRLNFERTRVRKLFHNPKAHDYDEAGGNGHYYLDFDNNDDDNDVKYMGKTITGSVRHLTQLSRNGLYIVSKLGLPHLFITLTTNINWPEIKEKLGPGQTAFDRPDIVCNVFKNRVDCMFHNLYNGKYFGENHLPEYVLKVVEYQHRGLPHIHIIVRLSNMPSEREDVVDWIDEHISTLNPDMDENSTPETYKLKEIVRGFMLHKCSERSEHNPTGCLNEKGICRKYFHRMRESNRTTFDDKGFPIYKRRATDLNVVTYNRLLSIDFDGHANVAYTEKTYTVNYVFSYIYKGNRKLHAIITSAKPNYESTFDNEMINDENEFNLFIKARKICSMDVMWKFFGFHTYPSSHPGVTVISAESPSTVYQMLEDGKVTKLFIYFNRSIALKQFTYTQFYQRYSYRAQGKEKVSDINYTDNNNKRTKVFKLKGEFVYFNLYERRDMEKTLVRLERLPLRIGDIAYMRILLSSNPPELQHIDERYPLSFEDLRTYHGVTYNSYQETCKAYGLLDDEDYVSELVRDICIYITNPRARRKHFAILTKEDFPTLHIFNNGDYTGHNGRFYKKLVEDWIYSYPPKSANEIKNLFLTELAQSFNDETRTIEDYKFPKPMDMKSEIDYEHIKYEKDAQNKLYLDMIEKYPLNYEQQLFFDAFVSKLMYVNDNSNSEPIFMFLNGSGGTGKSLLLTVVAAYVRSLGLICKISSATGLSASIFDDCSTVHSLFKIPVVEDCDKDYEDDSQMKLRLTKERIELLLETKVIIMDELPFLNRENLETIHNESELKGLKGKIIVAAGDFKQFLPVKQNGTKSEIIDITLSSSYLWNEFKKNLYVLKTNMRLTLNSNMNIYQRQQQITYADIIEDIGNNAGLSTFIEVEQPDGESNIDETIYRLYDMTYFVIPNDATDIKISGVMTDAVQWLFEADFTPEKATKIAICANTNKAVNKWNRYIQMFNNNEERDFYSKDSLADVDDENGLLKSMLTEDVLNTKNHPSVPPHKLTLRIGDVCILTRNISLQDKLVNNCRVKVIGFQNKFIIVETIGEVKVQYCLPRIKFRFRLPYGLSYYILRVQYPLRLAYSFTIHKTQGQTLDSVLVDMSESNFSHGSLYVALSRVRLSCKIAFIVNENNVGFSETKQKSYVKLKNIVYKTVIENIK